MVKVFEIFFALVELQIDNCRNRWPLTVIGNH